jgi:hypothetical protein
MSKKLLLGLSVVTISFCYPTQIQAWNPFKSFKHWNLDPSIDEYHRTLKMHEGYISKNGDNGHTLKEHVNVDFNYLRDKCRRGNSDYMSKFISYSSARETAQEIIKDNRKGINRFQTSHVMGVPESAIYSIAGPHDYVKGEGWWGVKNAVKCDPDVLGKKYGYSFWNRAFRIAGKYKDEVKLENARMEIMFNNARDKKRWYINTEYPFK